MKIVVLAGGVGAARFLEGLVQVTDPKDLTVIVNTGDDEDFYGLRVCPDIDTILYTLSGNHDAVRGWGLKDETYNVLNQLKVLENDTWFTLGDKDFATHIHRTHLLQQGMSLTDVTKNLATRFAIPFTILPMSDDSVKTVVTTPEGTLSFQEYFVKRRFKDTVKAIQYHGIEKASPTKSVLDAIEKADLLIIAPSNPIVSIGTILAVPGIKSAIKSSKAKKVAISPIVNGKAIKGPADTMLKDLGLEPSARGVAEYYKDFLETFFIDSQDTAQLAAINKLGIKALATNTIMKDIQAKKRLAQTIITIL
jgi:LPPG:FO 2-phospho-L-lactate transferase